MVLGPGCAFKFGCTSTLRSQRITQVLAPEPAENDRDADYALLTHDVEDKTQLLGIGRLA
jgi:hypothetical protein